MCWVSPRVPSHLLPLRAIHGVVEVLSFMGLLLPLAAGCPPFLRSTGSATFLRHPHHLLPACPTLRPRREPHGPARSGWRMPPRSRRSLYRNARSCRGRPRSARARLSERALEPAPSHRGPHKGPVLRTTCALSSPSLSCLAAGASSSRGLFFREATRGRCRWWPASTASRRRRGVLGSCRCSSGGEPPALTLPPP